MMHCASVPLSRTSLQLKSSIFVLLKLSNVWSTQKSVSMDMPPNKLKFVNSVQFPNHYTPMCEGMAWSKTSTSQKYGKLGSLEYKENTSRLKNCILP